ncbi:PAS domain-containing protein [Chondromyces apiculatus]|uniref:Anti-sigma-factor antagonist n=1 Tax=Chondromyces apiculatus DSM 436 TaxID=1192034 RepID=A0A017T6P1_9BACT|nr:PAS domain-containing protein [Chondromyces apiculatus]EYF04672.1 anti-sigma-factor antagonist [Chondromyces apiculatus DSM 436]
MSDVAALKAEIEALTRRNEALTQELAACQQREARYRGILDAQQELVVRFTRDQRLTYVNGAYCRYFGEAAESFIGTSIVPVLAEEERARVEMEIGKLGKDNPVWISEQRVHRPDGSLGWHRWTDYVILDEAGEVVEFQGVGTDVTEAREAAEAMRKQNEQLERAAVERAAQLRNFYTLTESVPDAVALVDGEGVIFYANPAYVRLAGNSEAPVGKRVVEVYPEVQETLVEAMRQVQRSGFWQGELLLPCKERGQLVVIATLVTIEGASGSGGVLGMVLRDVSAERKAEVERESLQARVIEAQDAMIRELSTPLLPLAEQVLALPLIGMMDNRRAAVVLDTLLNGVVEHQASTVLIDVTGVGIMDSHVADVLMRTAKAVRLLGAEVVLTGIQPHVAQTLVTLGVDVGAVVTLRSLKDGITFALRRKRQAAAAEQG